MKLSDHVRSIYKLRIIGKELLVSGNYFSYKKIHYSILQLFRDMRIAEKDNISTLNEPKLQTIQAQTTGTSLIPCNVY